MWQWIKRRFSGTEERAVTYQQGVSVGLIPAPTFSGMPVTEQTALGVSALWCGVRVISEAVGSLPPVLYRKSDQGRDRADNHPLSYLLSTEPNPEATRPVVWETAQAHAILYGNGFLEIERDQAGRPVALWNVHPNHVQVGRDSDTGTLVYRVQNGTTGGPPGSPGTSTILTANDMLHVPGLTPDGSVGYRLLTIARETLGFGMAAQRFGCSLFRNLGRPGGAYKNPVNVKLDDVGRENIKRSFRQETGGENVGNVILLEQGAEFTPFTMATNEQTQYKDLLTFFVYEIARLLNCPPSKLHSLEKATWGNLETLNADFLTTTLRPWLEKWEAEIEKKLLLPGEKGNYFVEFDTHQLLRVDQATRYSSYATASGNAPWLTVNEIRHLENKPPVDGGDELPGETDQVPDQQPADQGTEVKGADVADGAPVADSALNGLQVQSLLLIADKLVSKAYPPEAVTALIKASFPAVPDGIVSTIVTSLANAPEPVQPDQVQPDDQGADQPSDQPADEGGTSGQA